MRVKTKNKKTLIPTFSRMREKERHGLSCPSPARGRGWVRVFFLVPFLLAAPAAAQTIAITNGRVVVGDGSDIGGGASTMGTLSGGGTERVSIGERCLLGANAGIGISLGDDCVVEAGCYVTAGTKVTVLPGSGAAGEPTVVKAAGLSGASNVLFRRNSVSGAIEAVPWKGQGIALNEALHAND